MRLLTTAQVAKRYGVQVRTVSGWCQCGLFANLATGPITGRGKTHLIPESDLDGFTPPVRGRPTDIDHTLAAAAQRRSRQRQRTPSTTDN
jgi:hypothetical protein